MENIETAILLMVAGAVGHLIAAGGHGVGGSEDVLEVVGDGGVCAAGGHGVQRHLAGGDEVGQCVDRTLGQLLLEKLGLHAVGTDLIQDRKSTRLNSSH